MTRPSFIGLLVIISISLVVAQNVPPEPKGSGLFYFQVANVYFEVDSSFGGRISSLKVDNQEVMFVDRTYSVGPYWGSTFWPSPQTPVPVELDSRAYTGGISGNQLILTSTVAKKPPVQVIKKFQADSLDTSISITYRLINRGTAAAGYAGWEVTRVLPPGSLTFWPTGDTLFGDFSNRVVKNGDFSWYSYSTTDSDTGSKYYADGKEGWYGHVTADRVLFVKRFEDVPKSKQAPKEGEIELWLMSDHAYIEIENQSLYRQMAVNDTLDYVVKWYLRTLPVAIPVEIGSQDLINYARAIARPAAVRCRQTTGRLEWGKPQRLRRMSGSLLVDALFPDGATARLYDLSGKFLAGRNSNNNRIVFPVVPSGVYLLRVKANGVIANGRVVVE